MLKRLSLEDFEALRKPLESGRQSPAALAGILVLAVFLQVVLYALEYFVAADTTIHPYKEEILSVHFWINLALVILSIIYAVPAVYRRSGRIQYLVSIIVAQNLFGISFFISALFFIGRQRGGTNMTEEHLLNFTYLLLLLGVVVFVATFIRFYLLLHKGYYRKGEKKDALRERFETKSYIPAAIIGGIGLIFIIGYISKMSGIDDIQIIFFITLGILLFYLMLFILPEQLVILYCKFRFKSFNFNNRGYLESED